MADAQDILSYLKPNYNKLTPEQIKRQREFAYSIMKPPEREQYRSWAQPVRDVLNTLMGQQMLNNTAEADYGQREQAGGRAASTLRDARSLINQNDEAPPPLNQSISNVAPKQVANAENIAPPAEPETAPVVPPNQIQPPEDSKFQLDRALKKAYAIESDSGKNLGPNKFGYGGPFGFKNGSPLAIRLGLTEDNWDQPEAHVRAAAQHFTENAQAFKKRFGTDPSDGQLYLMHQQGTSGGLALMGGSPNGLAWETVKSAGNISDRLAKERLSANIPDKNILKSKPVDQITNQEFTRLWTDRLDKPDIPGKMNLGGPKEGEMQVAQAIPGVPPPTPLRHPAPNLNEKDLGAFFADPRIDKETKDKVYDQINKAATPAERGVVGGFQEVRPGAPEQQNLRGAAEKGTIHLGDMAIPTMTFMDPNGKQRTMYQLPDGELTTLKGLNDWNAQRKAGNTRVEDTARHSTASYEKEYDSIQDMATRSQNQVPMIQKMKALAQDPRFYSGSGDEKVLDFKKLLHAVGVAPGTTPPNEVFNKIVAGTTIGELSQFDKHGRVLATEFDQLKRSLANSNVTQPAIMDLLDMSEKLHNKAVKVGEEASNYTSKTEHGGLDRGWDKHLREWNKKNQVPSKEDVEKPASREIPRATSKKEYNPITKKWE